MTYQIPQDKKEEIQEKLLQIGLEIEGAAKRKCPVDTGRLRASINTKQQKGNTIQVGTNVEYAPYVEYGTEDMKAQPFLRPAFDEILNKYKGGVKI